MNEMGRRRTEKKKKHTMKCRDKGGSDGRQGKKTTTVQKLELEKEQSASDKKNKNKKLEA